MGAQRAPLEGRTVLVTRPQDQAQGLRTALQALGATVHAVPVIRIRALEDPGALRRAASQLGTYHWLVFTSRNGVFALAEQLPSPEPLPEGVRVACIGPATAEAVRQLGWPVHLQPSQYVAESLVEAFQEVGMGGRRVLLVRAQEARGALPEGLRRLGAQVEVVCAYRTEPAYNEAGRLQEVLRQGVDVTTFCSPSAVRAAVQLCGGATLLLEAVPAVCIGPVTASAALRAGLRVAAVAHPHTQEGLVEAVVRFVRGQGGQP
ncbi:MAG: hypothetical protein C4304_01590 [candidate division GAL15 bacterium]